MKLEVCLGLIGNLLVMIGEQFPFVERKFDLSVWIWRLRLGLRISRTMPRSTDRETTLGVKDERVSLLLKAIEYLLRPKRVGLTILFFKSVYNRSQDWP